MYKDFTITKLLIFNYFLLLIKKFNSFYSKLQDELSNF